MRRPTRFERGLREIHGGAVVTVTPHSRGAFLATWTQPQKVGLWVLGLLVTLVFGLASLGALAFGVMVLWATLTS